METRPRTFPDTIPSPWLTEARVSVPLETPLHFSGPVHTIDTRGCHFYPGICHLEWSAHPALSVAMVLIRRSPE